MTTRYVFDASEALKIVGIRDADHVRDERVLLRALAPVNLIRFAVLNAASVNENQIRDLNSRVFWFPAHEVARGDYIRVYTRNGRQNTHGGKFSGLSTTYHDFFWDIPAPIWSGESSAVVLLEIAAWDAKRS